MPCFTTYRQNTKYKKKKLLKMEFVSIKDLVWFGSILVGIVIWLFRDKIKNAEQELKISNLVEKINDVTNNKLIIKKEITKNIEDNMKITNQRIDRFKDEFNTYKDGINDTLKTFQDLHSELDKKVDVGFATILSELKSLKK